MLASASKPTSVSSIRIIVPPSTNRFYQPCRARSRGRHPAAHLALLVCLAVIPACTRKPLPKPEEPLPSSFPTAGSVQSREDAPATPASRRPAPLIPVRRTPLKPISPEALATIEMLEPPKTPEAATRQAVELERAYRIDREYVNRVETVHRLADASSPQSRDTLRRLFFEEQNLELRVQMVHSLSFVESDDFAPSMPILQEAIRPTQPRELREAAIDTIQSLNDPRAIPLLQIALADTDPELRESAERTIEYLNEVLQITAPRVPYPR